MADMVTRARLCGFNAALSGSTLSTHRSAAPRRHEGRHHRKPSMIDQARSLLHAVDKTNASLATGPRWKVVIIEAGISDLHLGFHNASWFKAQLHSLLHLLRGALRSVHVSLLAVPQASRPRTPPCGMETCDGTPVTSLSSRTRSTACSGRLSHSNLNG